MLSVSSCSELSTPSEVEGDPHLQTGSDVRVGSGAPCPWIAAVWFPLGAAQHSHESHLNLRACYMLMASGVIRLRFLRTVTAAGGGPSYLPSIPARPFER